MTAQSELDPAVVAQIAAELKRVDESVAAMHRNPWKPQDLPRKNAEYPELCDWIRKKARNYIEWLAFCDFAGTDDVSLYGSCKIEAEILGTQLAQRVGVPFDTGLRIARTEWKQGCARATEFHTALRRRLWPLGRMRADGRVILAEAEKVNEAFGWHLVNEQLIPLARQIALAAAPKARARYGTRRAA